MVTSCRTYPWRYGNRFELLVDGGRFFDRMLAAIEVSEHHVLVEICLVESGVVADRFITALTAAVSRGDVRRRLQGVAGTRPPQLNAPPAAQPAVGRFRGFAGPDAESLAPTAHWLATTARRPT